MLEFSSKRVEFWSKGTGVMDGEARIIAQMGDIVREAVELAREEVGSSLKAALSRAAMLLGITVRRVKAYLYGEVRSVPASEADHLRAKKIEMRHRQIATLETKLARLRAMSKELHEGNSREAFVVDRRRSPQERRTADTLVGGLLPAGGSPAWGTEAL